MPEARVIPNAEPVADTSYPVEAISPFQKKRARKASNSDGLVTKEIKCLKTQHKSDIELAHKQSERHRLHAHRAYQKNEKLAQSLDKTREQSMNEMQEHLETISVLEVALEKAEVQAARAEKKADIQASNAASLRAALHAAHIVNKHLSSKLEERVGSILEELMIVELMDAGKYTEQTRMVIRTLYNAGCPMKNIGRIISICFQLAGVKVKDIPSARTVGRVISGIIADIQIIFEFMNVDGKLFVACS